MPKTTIIWQWEEAFQKYGFHDGDNSQTYRIEDALNELGYQVITSQGIHNYHIVSICKSDKEWIIEDDENPRPYLPQEVVEELDALFPLDLEIEEY